MLFGGARDEADAPPGAEVSRCMDCIVCVGLLNDSEGSCRFCAGGVEVWRREGSETPRPSAEVCGSWSRAAFGSTDAAVELLSASGGCGKAP